MHKQFTRTGRLKIEKALNKNWKPCKIASRLHVYNATIYRVFGKIKGGQTVSKKLAVGQG